MAELTYSPRNQRNWILKQNHGTSWLPLEDRLHLAANVLTAWKEEGIKSSLLTDPWGWGWQQKKQDRTYSSPFFFSGKHVISLDHILSFLCIDIHRFLKYISSKIGIILVIHSFVREGTGAPLQYSCLENPMDGGAWWAAVHGVNECRTWLSDFTCTFHFHALEKEMATHSSVLAWRIPGMGEPGGLPSMGSHRIRHDWSDLATAAA